MRKWIIKRQIKFLYIVVIIVIMAFLLEGCRNITHDVLFGDIELTVPRGWWVEQDDREEFHLIVNMRKAVYINGTYLKPESEDMTLEEHLYQIGRELEIRPYTETFVMEDIILSGQPAKRLYYTGTMKEHYYTITGYVFPYKNESCYLAYAAKLSERDKYIEDFEEMIDKIELPEHEYPEG